jgi:hypothetical protein
MKWTALLLALVGCQHGGGDAAPKTSDAYRADIAALCDSMQLSGADQMQGDDQRIPTQAMWLGEHVKTPEGRAFMVSLNQLSDAQHAKALDDEAHRVGLAGCALSAEWRK